MKKYVSVYKIANYVYKRDQFTLRDLMTTFNLSKSTALRYIEALEEIGVPLYSEMGRYGGYRILDTYKIPPITFTPQETYAIFFAIKAMELLQSSPFQAEFPNILQKFTDSVSPTIRNSLKLLQTRVSFGATQNIESNPLLETLLHSIVNPTVIQITYQTADKQTIRRIQPLRLVAESGYWYCPSFDLDINEYRLFRSDRIKAIEVLEDTPPEHLSAFDLSKREQLVRKSPAAIDYIIEISEKGKTIFDRNHFPNMKIERKQDGFIISGWIEPAEMEFLLNYLHQFGQYLIHVEPQHIKQKFVEHLDWIRDQIV